MHPLVELAKRAVEEYTRHGRRLASPPEFPEEFRRPAGAFVSIKKKGDLRGCIGTIEPRSRELPDEVIENAISACSGDPRFMPVEPDELDDLSYSVDVLGSPEPVGGREELDPKIYGVIVKKGLRRGLLLPDLEGVDTVEKQLAITKRKAGIALDEENIEIARFRVTRYR
ncbi:MAG: AmmeMemoRadiSam system protein A [Nitrospirae bacterium]|nr:AmmeMemoRadiSam system protein A [Nitrospirota bacterium]